MGNLQAAYDWAVNECTRPNTEYQLGDNRSKTINGITYWDCSSFIWGALRAGGYDMPEYPFTTGNDDTDSYVYAELGCLLRAGFTLVGNFYPGSMPESFELKNGDVLLRGASYWGGAGYNDGRADDSNLYGHTEMVYDGAQRKVMGAHYHDASNPEQDVSIRDTPGSAGTRWFYVLRDLNGNAGGGGTMVPITPSMIPVENESGYTWHGVGTGFEDTSAEAIENAKIITWFCYRAGWTPEAIAALLGNISRECGMDPAAGEVGGTGYGLVQWTPSTVLTNAKEVVYGSGTSRQDSDGTVQMNVMLAEYAQSCYSTNTETDDSFARDFGSGINQWYASRGRSYGFDYDLVSYWDWAHNTDGYSVGDLTKIFMCSYERPNEDQSVNHWSTRVSAAEYWYGLVPGFIAGFNWGPYNPVNPVKKKNRRMPVWMMVYPMAWQLTSM